MILELHLLQSFPVSNLNRDDVGQPKTATFGGHTRARISSQSLKRAARLLFNDHGLDTDETGVRTKRLVDSTTDLLVTRGREESQAREIVIAALGHLGFGVDAGKGLTQYLLFVGRSSIEHLAEYCTANWEAMAKIEKKGAKAKPDKTTSAEAKRILDGSRAVDVALFGRMIADNKDFNVDAASQVAHALSTHAVVNEFDFYTAVDDLKPTEDSGADMIGTVDFNSACYYRYANVDLAQLARNLGDDTQLATRGVTAWLHAFVNAVPGGKQNSTAARTMPDTLLGVVRDTGAWNLANAFLKPVTDIDLMAASTDRLTEHFTRLRDFYGSTGLRAVVGASVTGALKHLPEGEIVTGVDEFTDRLLTAATA
ncbi:type I-E CRISPR-associated protein Cas7/Cse4/CasC [Saccharothrix xinjiangensis]|uniref:Type I-E CRISPR-associated protein Cas7/Cse4/CasC n=1 Tax=Saccharothrix xinjiangensis TaxID=204798 RepID=A0ABV9YDI5_9PSEU